MSAEQGWIADPSPPPPRDYHPGEERKWRMMMGNGQFWQFPTEKDKDRLRETQ